jgi:hypothetical protein
LDFGLFTFFSLGLFSSFVLCWGGDFATTSTARSKRSHASDSSGAIVVGVFAMAAKLRSEGKKFDELAKALGYVTIAWGRLENDLSEFIELLVPLEEGDISRSVTAHLDIRSKVQTIKALAFLRKPYDEWFNKMLIYLDYIDNNLRPRRNRFIHDGWYRPGGKIIRRMHQVKFERPQAFQLVLRTETKVPMKLAEIRQLAIELDDLVFITFAFWYDFAYPDERRSLRARVWKRFLRRANPMLLRRM